MTRCAFGSIEELPDGRWRCLRDFVLEGPAGTVAIKLGQTFHPGTVYAGYDNFVAYLQSVSVAASGNAPRA